MSLLDGSGMLLLSQYYYGIISVCEMDINLTHRGQHCQRYHQNASITFRLMSKSCRTYHDISLASQTTISPSAQPEPTNPYLLINPLQNGSKIKINKASQTTPQNFHRATATTTTKLASPQPPPPSRLPHPLNSSPQPDSHNFQPLDVHPLRQICLIPPLAASRHHTRHPEEGRRSQSQRPFPDRRCRLRAETVV